MTGWRDIKAAAGISLCLLGMAIAFVPLVLVGLAQGERPTWTGVGEFWRMVWADCADMWRKRHG